MANVNVKAVVVGDAEAASGRGDRGINEIDNEAAKLTRDTDNDTGRTAIEGFG